MAWRYPSFNLAPRHPLTGLEYWTGQLWPFRRSITDIYRVELRYRRGADPGVYVVAPAISRSSFPDHPHLYRDDSICSYFPGDHTWNRSRDDVSVLIDMAAGWIVQHVCWRWFGVWPGYEVEH